LIHVAVCQVSLLVGDTPGNRAASLAAATEAADAGAAIIVLPELAHSGYVFASPAEARAAAERPDGPTVSGWAELAASRDVIVIGGFAELGEDGLLYNSAVLADPGGLRAIYRKAHLWHAEADFFEPGSDPPPVVETEHGRIAVMICYDVEFPEWVRLPALAGADLLAVPTNWPAEPVPQGERPLVVANVQTAAYANRMFIAAACRTGDERGVSWVGGSLIAGPDGYPLAGPAGTDEARVLVAACDLRRARSKASGARNDAHGDRRPELYGPVLNG
jgi:predicted amidohydrolase